MSQSSGVARGSRLEGRKGEKASLISRAKPEDRSHPAWLGFASRVSIRVSSCLCGFCGHPFCERQIELSVQSWKGKGQVAES